MTSRIRLARPVNRMLDRVCIRCSSSSRPILPPPSWSTKELTKVDTGTQTEVTSEQLTHLLKLSALPAPESHDERSKLLQDLNEQMHFVRSIQEVDVEGVEPLINVALDSQQELDLSGALDALEAKDKAIATGVLVDKAHDTADAKQTLTDYRSLAKKTRRGFYVVSGGLRS
ncbi:hypothetical protein PYCC9005_000371 [Savitreella phatthalungensis]